LSPSAQTAKSKKAKKADAPPPAVLLPDLSAMNFELPESAVRREEEPPSEDLKEQVGIKP